MSAWTCNLLRDNAGTQKWASTSVALCEEHGYQLIHSWSSVLLGWVQAEGENVNQGIVAMRDALDRQRSLGSQIMRAHFLALIAEALAKTGNCGEGLAVLAEALDTAHVSGDRYYEAEIHRLRGEVLLMQAPAARARADAAAVEAETCYRRAIEIARHQQAKLFELRAAISLGRLYRQSGRPEEAREAVAGVCSWFTEGFDIPDLLDARRFLDGLD
jgi:predicted ATPase